MRHQPAPSPEAGDIVEQFYAESDRGVALICAEHLSKRLEDLLRSKLSRLTPSENKNLVTPMFRGGGSGPLSSFSARIKFAYAFGWIPKDIYEDLELIRGIRNTFAHDEAPLKFDLPALAAKARKLQNGYEFEAMLRIIHTQKGVPLNWSTERSLYLGAFIFIRADLIGLAGGHGKKWKRGPVVDDRQFWENAKQQLATTGSLPSAPTHWKTKFRKLK